PAELLRHHRAAGSAHWPLLAEAAADAALRAGRAAEAVTLLTAAAEHTAGRRRARVVLKLSRAALTGLPDPGTVALLRSVLDGPAPPPAVRGELRLNTGLLLRNQTGAGAAGRNEIAEAIADLTHAPGLATRAMSALAVPAVDGWPFSRHLEWLGRAEELAAGVDDPVVRITLRTNRASTLMFTADPRAWQAVRELPAEARSPAEWQHLVRAHTNLAHAALGLGHPGPAGRFLARAEELLHGSQSAYYAGLARTARLLLDRATGRWAGLDGRAAAAAAEYADIPVLAAEATLLCGLQALAAGRTGAARQLLDRARESVRLDTGTVTAGAAGALCRIELAAGHPGRAWAHAGPAIDTLRRIEAWVWAADVLPGGVRALLRLGERAAARALTEEFADGVAGRDAPAPRAALAACRAALAEPSRPAATAAADLTIDEAAARWTEAERAWAGAGRPYEAARARLARGRVALTAGRPDGGEDVVAAIDRFAGLGAHWDLAAARRVLKEAGITPPARGGRRSYGDALSPREREVAELAARGLGNAEIAGRLVLSRRTVEHHVAGAMRKLAVTSRTALAGALDDTGTDGG
ncbi:LuxR C-terminal-related transcriptional regulator, partial [Kitasatospora sp. NPDC004240]